MSVLQELVQKLEDGQVEDIHTLLEKKHDTKGTVDKYKTRDGSTPLKGISPLHLAALKGLSVIVDDFMQHGYDATIRNKYDGNTLVHYAALGGHDDLLDYFKAFGADVKATNNVGETALHAVARCTNDVKNVLNTIKKLDSCEVNFNKQNKDGDTALHLAMKTQPIVVLAELVLLTDGSLHNKAGDTVLHLAAQSRLLDEIDTLVSLGLHVNQKNKAGHIPLHTACRHDNEEAVEALLMNLAVPIFTPKGVVKKGRMETLMRMASALRDEMAIRLFISANRQTFSTKCPLGSVYPIENTGLAIQNTIYTGSTEFSLYCRREDEERSSVNFHLEDEEEYASDTFVIKWQNNSESTCQITLRVPFYRLSGPGEELVVRFYGGLILPVDEWERNIEDYTCLVPMDIIKGEGSWLAIAVTVRPKRQHFELDSSSTVLNSEVDRRFKLEVPDSTFKEKVKLDLQVYGKTDVVDELQFESAPSTSTKEEDHELTDVYQVTVSKQPSKPIKMTLPLLFMPKDAKDIVVVTCNEDMMDDEEDLEILDCIPTVKGSCIEFPISHFSIFATATRREVTISKKPAFERIDERQGKSFRGVFYVVAKLLKSNLYHVIVECTPRDKGRDKRYKYKELGYETQDPIESEPIKVRTSQIFTVEFSGSFALDDPSSDTSLKICSRMVKKREFYIKVLKCKGTHADGACRVSRPIISGHRKKAGPSWNKEKSVKLPMRLKKPPDFWSDVYDKPV